MIYVVAIMAGLVVGAVGGVAVGLWVANEEVDAMKVETKYLRGLHERHMENRMRKKGQQWS